MNFLTGGREDLDRLCAYNTRQQVNILDRWLGLLNYGIQLVIVAYYIGYIMIYDQGYLEFEAAKGVTATHVRGDMAAISTGRAGTRYFSSDEITFPGLENGNVFIATRVNVNHQQRGICEDHRHHCQDDSDCHQSVGGTCTENDVCQEPSWCDVNSQDEIYTLDMANTLIWVKSSIMFVRLNSERIFTTETLDGPRLGVNTFSVKDLLLMCEPAPVRYEEVSELGAAIEVQFVWNCNVESEDCQPLISSRRIDTVFDPEHIGFQFSNPLYTAEDEREIMRYKGVRLFFRTVGTGRKTSTTAIIMKISTGLALLGVAPIMADLLMLRVFKLGKKFEARKYEFSEDFSDYFQKVKDMKSEAEKQRGPQFADDEVRKEELEWQKQLDEQD